MSSRVAFGLTRRTRAPPGPRASFIERSQRSRPVREPLPRLIHDQKGLDEHGPLEKTRALVMPARPSAWTLTADGGSSENHWGRRRSQVELSRHRYRDDRGLFT